MKRRSGPLSALLIVLMFAGCLLLWIGVPLGWLWIGSQIQAAASLGTTLAIAMVGAISTIIGLVYVLAWLDGKHAELRLARAGGTDPEPTHGENEEEPRGSLEPMIVGSAAIAVLIFAIWFLFFAGTSPVPLNIGY